jgi:hypothetical protein
VLHDVDLAEDPRDLAGPLGDDGLVVALARLEQATAPAEALAAAAAVGDRLVARWQAWADDAGPVADAPFARVLEIVIRDTLGDLAR